MSVSRGLAAFAERLDDCARCPRLAEHRRAVGKAKRRAYADETYWARPVPGFGDPAAELLLVGLAPGAHGANRTGRIFTGDRSGEFLYAALHRAGLASAPRSVGRDDGLELRGAFITMPVRCVPPGNKPTPKEIATCRRFFHEELSLLPRVRVVLALGAIALAETLRASGAPASALPFAHGASAAVPWRHGGGSVTLFASYHVSQQNTQTGRLTAAMFDEVLSRCLAHVGGSTARPAAHSSRRELSGKPSPKRAR